MPVTALHTPPAPVTLTHVQLGELFFNHENTRFNKFYGPKKGPPNWSDQRQALLEDARDFLTQAGVDDEETAAWLAMNFLGRL